MPISFMESRDLCTLFLTHTVALPKYEVLTLELIDFVDLVKLQWTPVIIENQCLHVE